MSKVITVELSEPLSANGKEYHTLDIRKPTVGDLEEATEASSGSSEIALIRELVGVLANVPPNTLKKLSIDDFAEVSKAINPFFAKFQQMQAK